ncbi:MAG: hypothetical protein ACRBFS_19530 [Aureispira sp.]
MKEKNEGEKNIGCPPKYNDETKDRLNKQAYELALLGLRDQDIAPVLGIVESTLNEWKKKFPEFSESIKKGKVLADAKVAAGLHKLGKGFTSLEVSFKGANLAEGTLVGFDLENLSPYEMLNLGKLLGVKDASISIKQVPPSEKAASRWLGNRQRKHWSINPDNKKEDDPLEGTPIVYQLHIGDGEYMDVNPDGESEERDNVNEEEE